MLPALLLYGVLYGDRACRKNASFAGTSFGKDCLKKTLKLHQLLSMFLASALMALQILFLQQIQIQIF